MDRDGKRGERRGEERAELERRGTRPDIPHQMETGKSYIQGRLPSALAKAAATQSQTLSDCPVSDGKLHQVHHVPYKGTQSSTGRTTNLRVSCRRAPRAALRSGFGLVSDCDRFCSMAGVLCLCMFRPGRLRGASVFRLGFVTRSRGDPRWIGD